MFSRCRGAALRGPPATFERTNVLNYFHSPAISPPFSRFRPRFSPFYMPQGAPLRCPLPSGAKNVSFFAIIEVDHLLMPAEKLISERFGLQHLHQCPERHQTHDEIVGRHQIAGLTFSKKEKFFLKLRLLPSRSCYRISLGSARYRPRLSESPKSTANTLSRLTSQKCR